MNDFLNITQRSIIAVSAITTFLITCSEVLWRIVAVVSIGNWQVSNYRAPLSIATLDHDRMWTRIFRRMWTRLKMRVHTGSMQVVALLPL